MAKVTASVPPKQSLSFSDQKTRGQIYQFITIALLIWFVWWIIDNTATNMRDQNIEFGFKFLNTQAGFGIIQSLIDYSEESSYGRVFFVGLINNLVVAFVGCLLATILGFIVGVGRLSSNWCWLTTSNRHANL